MSHIAKIYHDLPIFGIDIGTSNIKVMQLAEGAKKRGAKRVLAYGACAFPDNSIKDGVIVDFESLAGAVYALFDKELVGKITTNRVIASIPASATYNRIMTVPANLSGDDLESAIQLEVQQYVPLPYEQLYVDYEYVVSQSPKQKEINTEKPAQEPANSEQPEPEHLAEILLTAAPRNIVDSYIQLFDILGLQVIGIETSLTATGRSAMRSEDSGLPTLLIDFGSTSMDLSVFDGGALRVTGTVAGGGDTFTEIISQALGVSEQQGHLIKVNYGLNRSKKQDEITAALEPTLQTLIREVRKMMRFYKERSGTNKDISQIITIGGGANMPGLSDYLVSSLRLPVRMCDTWRILDFDRLQPPHETEKSMYATVAGLALANPKEVV